MSIVFMFGIKCLRYKTAVMKYGKKHTVTYFVSNVRLFNYIENGIVVFYAGSLYISYSYTSHPMLLFFRYHCKKQFITANAWRCSKSMKTVVYKFTNNISWWQCNITLVCVGFYSLWYMTLWNSLWTQTAHNVHNLFSFRSCREIYHAKS